MWIDTHCHLDANEYENENDAIAQRAAHLQVSGILIPSVDQNSFPSVSALAHKHANCFYALGIHPLYVPKASEKDLITLREIIHANIDDPKLVAMGEIGLDLYKPQLKESPLREKQDHFFVEQLKIAREFQLPVLLHTRRAVDTVLKYLRQISPQSGIAHAFSGSLQQAQAFIQLGFKISFCGTFTYERAQRLRKLATNLPLDTIVLETDAPDLPPAWLQKQYNSPEEIPRIGEELAALRGIPIDEMAAATTANALEAIPRLILETPDR